MVASNRFQQDSCFVGLQKVVHWVQVFFFSQMASSKLLVMLWALLLTYMQQGLAGACIFVALQNMPGLPSPMPANGVKTTQTITWDLAGGE